MNMEWMSERVGPGGVFQPAKVKYSPETKKFLQELMVESKMTTFQRQKVNYALRAGEPLPPLHKMQPKPPKPKEPIVIMRDSINHRRPQASIIESGAYELDSYTPINRGVDREFAKKHLQDYMTFGKQITDQPKPKKKVEETESFRNRFDDLKEEIRERVEWLAEMDELGEGHKYRDVMQQQIAGRIREMGQLKSADDK